MKAEEPGGESEVSLMRFEAGGGGHEPRTPRPLEVGASHLPWSPLRGALRDTPSLALGDSHGLSEPPGLSENRLVLFEAAEFVVTGGSHHRKRTQPWLRDL